MTTTIIAQTTNQPSIQETFQAMILLGFDLMTHIKALNSDEANAMSEQLIEAIGAPNAYVQADRLSPVIASHLFAQFKQER